MTDNSPMLLRLETNGAEYKFFQFTMDLNNELLFGNVYDLKDLDDDIFKKIDLNALTQLLTKFSLEASQSTIASFSVFETVLLLVSVDLMAKMLLGQQSADFKRSLEQEFPSIGRDWDIVYLKNAQTLFHNYKHKFQNYPKLVELIDGLTNLTDID